MIKKTKDKLQGRKKIRIEGIKFVIRKINPLLDFNSKNIPQIFTYFQERKEIDKRSFLNEMQIKNIKEDTEAVIRAGVVDPAICEKDEDGVTIDDIMRSPEISGQLYSEIIVHSLDLFKGIKGVFFSIKLRRFLFMLHLQSSINSLAKSSLEEKAV